MRHEQIAVFVPVRTPKVVDVKLTLHMFDWTGTDAQLVSHILEEIRTDRVDLAAYFVNQEDQTPEIIKSVVWVDDNITPMDKPLKKTSKTMRSGYIQMSQMERRKVSREYFEMLRSGTNKMEARATLAKKYDRNPDYIAFVANKWK